MRSEKQYCESFYRTTKSTQGNSNHVSNANDGDDDDALISALDTVVWRIPGSSWWRDIAPDQPNHGSVRYWLRVPLIDENEVNTQAPKSSITGQSRYWLAKLIIVRKSESITLSGTRLCPTHDQHTLCIELVSVTAGTHWKVYWTDNQNPVQLITPSTTGCHVIRRVKHDPVQLSPGIRLSGWVSGHWYRPPKSDLASTYDSDYPQSSLSSTLIPGSITYSWCFIVPVSMTHLSRITVHLLPPEKTGQKSVTPTQFDQPIVPVRSHVNRCDKHDRQIAPDSSIATGRSVYSRTQHQLTSTYTSKPEYNHTTSTSNKTNLLRTSSWFTGVVSSTAESVNETNSALSPLLPLLEPDSRLVIHIEEHCSNLSESTMSQTGTNCISSIRSSSNKPFPTRNENRHRLDSLTRSESLSSLGLDNSSNFYTHIQTSDGRPAHINGTLRCVNNSGSQSSTQSTNPYVTQVRNGVNKESNVKRPMDDADSCKNPGNVTQTIGVSSSSTSPHSPLIHTEMSFQNATSKTYLLKQLDIVNNVDERDSVPPPWMLKLKSESTNHSNEPAPRCYSSQQSWNTVGTMDSAGSESPLTTGPGEGSYFKRANEDRFDKRSESSLGCDDSEPGGDHLQPKRGPLISELLAELHAFAEYVVYQQPILNGSDGQNDLTDESNNETAGVVTNNTQTEILLKGEYETQVVERRKRIFQHLTTLCDEEDEEEEEEDEDDETREQEYVLDSPDLQDKIRARDHHVRPQSRVSSISGNSDIALPLPKACRIASPMRLIACYYEMLSTLADLQMSDRKKRLFSSKHQTELVDLSAAFLRVLTTTTSTAGRKSLGHLATDRSNCVFGLYLLHQLGVLLTYAPWPADYNAPALLGSSLSFHNIHTWFPYTKQVQLALDEHREWLVRILGQEFVEEWKAISVLKSMEPVQDWMDYSRLLETYSEQLVKCLSEGAQDTIWMNKITLSLEGTKREESSDPNDEHTQNKQAQSFENEQYEQFETFDRMWATFSWDCFIDCCALEANAWQKYFDSDWHSIPPVSASSIVLRVLQNTEHDTESIAKTNICNLVKQWFEEEVTTWRERKKFIRENCHDLPAMAQLLASSHKVDMNVYKDSKLKVIPAVLRDLDHVHEQALDQFVFLEFCDQLVHLPDGMQHLITCLYELSGEMNCSEGELSQSTGDKFTSDHVTRWKLQLRQLQHRLCLELSYLRKVHEKHSHQPASWLDSWTAHLSVAYQSLVHCAAVRQAQLQHCWLQQAFDTWIRCAEPWIDRITPLTRTADLSARDDESAFISSWLLLYDGESLQQAYWKANRERLNIIKTALPHPPDEFVTYLAKIRLYIDRVISNCESDSNQIVPLLHSLEQSPRDLVTTKIVELINHVVLGSINQDECPDKLHALIHALRVQQRAWERRLRLTQRAIDVATNPMFIRGSHAKFVRTWIDSVSLRRDWQGKIICALERITRAGEVVEAERFPLRPLTSFAPRFIRNELLRQEQTFIEALHYAIELHPVESEVIRGGLAVCESQSSSVHGIGLLNGILEELKHVYSRMVHDPCLGQTGGTKPTRDKFTAFLENRARETENLLQYIKATSRVNWIAGSPGVTMTDQESLSHWLNMVATRFGLEQCLRDSRCKRLQLQANEWESYRAKMTYPHIKPCNTGFVWTPISIKSETFDLFRRPHFDHNSIPICADEKTATARLEAAMKLAQHELPEVPHPISSSSYICPTHGIQEPVALHNEWASILRTIENELRERKPEEQGYQQVDLMVSLERISLRLLILLSQLNPDHIESTESCEPRVPSIFEWNIQLRKVTERMKTSWHQLIGSAEFGVELAAFLRRWSERLDCLRQSQSNQSTANGDLHSCRILSSKQNVIEITRHVQVFHIMLESLCDALFRTYNEKSRDSSQSLPQWLIQARKSVNMLLYWLPTTELAADPNCSDCRLGRIHIMLDMVEKSATDSIQLPLPVGQDPINQLDALYTWLQFDSRLRSLPSIGPNTETEIACTSSELWEPTVRRIEEVRDRAMLIDQACCIYRQLYQFTTEMLQQTELIDAGNPVHVEELRAALHALENNLHSIAPDSSVVAHSAVYAVHHFWLRQVRLLHKILPSSDTWTQNSTSWQLVNDSASPHQNINHILAEVNRIETKLTNTLTRCLNTQISDCILESTESTVTAPRSSYDLSLKLPADSELANMYAQMNHLEHYCRQAKSLLGHEQEDSVGLIAQPVDVTTTNDSSVVYTLNLLKQLQVAVVCSPKDLQRRVDQAVEEIEKLRELLGALSEHVHESPIVEHRLYLALPNLTGSLMDDLTRAVDELELRATQCRLESPVPLQTHSWIGESLKHAGQRLMELETSLEHACESIRILLLLSIGDRLWTNKSKQRLSLIERGTVLQADYEHSFGYAQLHVAWARLAQLGDRLGRIQAGLPIRPSNDSGFGALDDEHPTYSRQRSHNSRDSNLPGVDRRVHTAQDDAQQLESENPVENAGVVRRKRLGLRDVLGSHVCVYPECKQAQTDWVDYTVNISSEQISIVEKIRKAFVEVVHFYAQLKKTLIETRRPNSRQTVSQAAQQTFHPKSGKGSYMDWHQNEELSRKYQELMTRVEQLSKCDLPQIKKLKEKAESLEVLWYGQSLSTEDLNDLPVRPLPEKAFSPDQSSPEDHIDQTHLLNREHQQMESGSEPEESQASKSNASPRVFELKNKSNDLSMLHEIARDHFEKLFSNELNGLEAEYFGSTKQNQGTPAGSFGIREIPPLSAIETMNAARESLTRKTNRAKQKRDKKKRKGKGTSKSANSESVGNHTNSTSEKAQSPAIVSEMNSLHEESTPIHNGFPHGEVDMSHRRFSHGTANLVMSETAEMADPLIHSSGFISCSLEKLTKTQQFSDPFIIPSSVNSETVVKDPSTNLTPRDLVSVQPISICGNDQSMNIEKKLPFPSPVVEVMEENSLSGSIAKSGIHHSSSVNNVVDSALSAQLSTSCVNSTTTTQWINDIAETDTTWITVKNKPKRRPKVKPRLKTAPKTKTTSHSVNQNMQLHELTAEYTAKDSDAIQSSCVAFDDQDAHNPVSEAPSVLESLLSLDSQSQLNCTNQPDANTNQQNIITEPSYPINSPKPRDAVNPVSEIRYDVPEISSNATSSYQDLKHLSPVHNAKLEKCDGQAVETKKEHASDKHSELSDNLHLPHEKSDVFMSPSILESHSYGRKYNLNQLKEKHSLAKEDPQNLAAIDTRNIDKEETYSDFDSSSTDRLKEESPSNLSDESQLNVQGIALGNVNKPLMDKSEGNLLICELGPPKSLLSFNMEKCLLLTSNEKGNEADETNDNAHFPSGLHPNQTTPCNSNIFDFHATATTNVLETERPVKKECEGTPGDSSADAVKIENIPQAQSNPHKKTIPKVTHFPNKGAINLPVQLEGTLESASGEIAEAISFGKPDRIPMHKNEQLVDGNALDSPDLSTTRELGSSKSSVNVDTHCNILPSSTEKDKTIKQDTRPTILSDIKHSNETTDLSSLQQPVQPHLVDENQPKSQRRKKKKKSESHQISSLGNNSKTAEDHHASQQSDTMSMADSVPASQVTSPDDSGSNLIPDTNQEVKGIKEKTCILTTVNGHLSSLTGSPQILGVGKREPQTLSDNSALILQNRSHKDSTLEAHKFIRSSDLPKANLDELFEMTGDLIEELPFELPSEDKPREILTTEYENNSDEDNLFVKTETRILPAKKPEEEKEEIEQQQGPPAFCENTNAERDSPVIPTEQSEMREQDECETDHTNLLLTEQENSKLEICKMSSAHEGKSKNKKKQNRKQSKSQSTDSTKNQPMGNTDQNICPSSNEQWMSDSKEASMTQPAVNCVIPGQSEDYPSGIQGVSTEDRATKLGSTVQVHSNANSMQTAETLINIDPLTDRSELKHVEQFENSMSCHDSADSVTPNYYLENENNETINPMMMTSPTGLDELFLQPSEQFMQCENTMQSMVEQDANPQFSNDPQKPSNATIYSFGDEETSPEAPNETYELKSTDTERHQSSVPSYSQPSELINSSDNVTQGQQFSNTISSVIERDQRGVISEADILMPATEHGTASKSEAYTSNSLGKSQKTNGSAASGQDEETKQLSVTNPPYRSQIYLSDTDGFVHKSDTSDNQILESKEPGLTDFRNESTQKQSSRPYKPRQQVTTDSLRLSLTKEDEPSHVVLESLGAADEMHPSWLIDPSSSEMTDVSGGSKNLEIEAFLSTVNDDERSAYKLNLSVSTRPNDTPSENLASELAENVSHHPTSRHDENFLSLSLGTSTDEPCPKSQVTHQTIHTHLSHETEKSTDEEEEEEERFPSLFEEMSISPDGTVLSENGQSSGLTDLDDVSSLPLRLSQSTHRGDRIHLHPIIEQPSDQSTFEDEFLNGVVDESPEIYSTPSVYDTPPAQKPLVVSDQEKVLPASELGTRIIRKARRRLQPGRKISPQQTPGVDSKVSVSDHMTSKTPSIQGEQLIIEGLKGLSVDHNLVGRMEKKITLPDTCVDNVPYSPPPSVQALAEVKPTKRTEQPVFDTTSWEESTPISDSCDSEVTSVFSKVKDQPLFLALNQTAISLSTVSIENLSPAAQNVSTTLEIDHATDKFGNPPDGISALLSVEGKEISPRSVRFADLHDVQENNGSHDKNNTNVQSVLKKHTNERRIGKNRKSSVYKKEKINPSGILSDTVKTSTKDAAFSPEENLSDFSVGPDKEPTTVLHLDSVIKRRPGKQIIRSTVDRFTQTYSDDYYCGYEISTRYLVTNSDQSLAGPSDSHPTATCAQKGVNKSTQTKLSTVHDRWTIVFDSCTATQSTSHESIHSPSQRRTHEQSLLTGQSADERAIIPTSQSFPNRTRRYVNSCCRYLWSLLGLILLLLLLLGILCLILLPKCGSNFLWTGCMEDTVVWRYLNYPLGLSRVRRPPV